jgi:Ni/Fe-hydrogenase subunit HybB-like protein
MVAQLLEFSPAIAEWLGAKKARKILSWMTLGAVIFGITLSTLHQSGLGALYLMAKEKIHPLWYSEFIPILFFISSIFAGLSMVIFEGSISHRVFHAQISEENKHSHDGIVHGLSKICAFAMMVYLFLQIVVFVHGKHWMHLNSRMGAWYLTEMLGFVVFPMVLYFLAYRKYHISLVKVASLITMVGIIINRLNVTVIGFQWDEAVRYVPSWMEIVVTLTVLSIEIWIFRAVVRRLPVLREGPEWATDDH